MKALVGAFNQKKALVGAFSVIVQPHRLIVCSTSPDLMLARSTAGKHSASSSSKASCEIWPEGWLARKVLCLPLTSVSLDPVSEQRKRSSSRPSRAPGRSLWRSRLDSSGSFELPRRENFLKCKLEY